MAGPCPEHIELYTQGSCHVFASACLLAHPGDFLVAQDAGKAHWQSDEGDVDVVIHVFARHIVEDGRIIVRDILGDRCFGQDYLEDRLKEELSERYDVWAGDIYFSIMSRDELNELVDDADGEFGRLMGSSDEYAQIQDLTDRPLHEVCAADLEEAAALDEVRAAPGTRPAPEPYEAPPPAPGL